MIRLCNKIIIYIKTGYLLHLITLAELLMIYIMLHTLRLGHWMMQDDTTTRFFILLPFLWSPVFPQLDARSRYQDYKMMKDYFYLYSFDARLVKCIAKSRCQRDAVIVAAKEMGVKEQCKNYFDTCGYRWYHLFPDVIFEKPAVLLSRQFWQTTFFAKTYRPKVDYSSVGRTSVNDMPLQRHKAA